MKKATTNITEKNTDKKTKLSKCNTAKIRDPTRPSDDQTQRDKRWATSGARLAKTALCAGLACGRSLRVASSGCVGARWSEEGLRSAK